MRRSLWSPTCLALLFAISSAFTKEEGDTCNNGKWSCKKITDCPKAQAEIRNGSRPEICAFAGKVPIVCCAPDVKQKSDDILLTRGGFPSKSKQICKTYAEAVYEKVPNPVPLINGDEYDLNDQCGVNDEPLIIGGTNAGPAEFPHMALIGHRDNPTLWICSGSLISDQWILSAAHCTATYQNTLAKWALLGDLKVNSDKDRNQSSPLTLKIIKRVNHPDYRPSLKYHDIALYKLNETVRFNKYIRPLCLQTPDMQYENRVLTAGWGQINATDSKSNSHALQKVVLDYMRDTGICKQEFTKANAALKAHIPNGIDTSSMVCAFTPGKDTCYGDSGGPLMIRLDTPYCMYSIIGITSFGDGCATNLPGVYTKVSNYIPWIEETVWG